MIRSDFTPTPNGGARVEVRHSYIGPGIGLMLFGLLFGGVPMLIWLNARDSPGWFLAIFVLVGAAAFCGGIWVLISGIMVTGRLAPAALTISRHPLRLGEAFELRYEQPVRRRHAIVEVTATLEFQEVAIYQVGTNRRTQTHAKSVKKTLLLGGEAEAGTTLAAATTFVIPADGMHSFEATNNKTIWRIKLLADIAGLPDFKAESKLLVVPRLAPPTDSAAAADWVAVAEEDDGDAGPEQHGGEEREGVNP